MPRDHIPESIPDLNLVLMPDLTPGFDIDLITESICDLAPDIVSNMISNGIHYDAPRFQMQH